MKIKELQTTNIGLTIGLVAVVFLVLTASAAAQTSVIVESATGVESGATFTINVTLSDTPAAGIGAYGFNITFDTTVVQVTDANALVGFGIPNWDNDAGWVILGGAVYPGAGDGIYGDITFEVIGADGTSTTLALTVDDLTDGDTNSVSHTDTDGLVTIGEVTVTSVTVESATVAEEGTTTIDVTLSDTPEAGIGAYGFNITFDPTVVQVTDANALVGFGIPNWNNDAGWVILGGAVYPGAGDGIYGDITFEAIGADGTSTTLALTVDDLTDGDTNPVTSTVTNGLVTVGVPPEEVVINEFIPDPEGDDNAPMPGGEWVELYNKGDTEVNVSGWILYDSVDTNELYITPENTNTGDTIVPALGWLVVYRDGDTDFSLNQAADDVRLYDGYPVAESTLIDETSYASSTEGKSWARIPDGTGDFVEADPTPGETNVPIVLHVVINEFIAARWTYPATDLIELYNPTDADVDLTDWTLVAHDPESTTAIAPLDGETITAGGYLVYECVAEGPFTISQSEDILILKNGSDEVDRVAWGDYDDGNIADNAPAPGLENSTGRYPNGVDTDVDIDDFRVFTNTTIGEDNTPPEEDTTPPVVTSPTAIPPTILADGIEESQLSVTVTDDSEIHSVTIDLSAIGGSATTVMTDMGDSVYSVTTTAAVGTALGLKNLQVNATDIYGNSNTAVSIPLTVGVGVPPTVSIYTDTTFYMQGNTMHLGLDVTNPGGELPVRFAVWLELPDGGIYVLTYTSVTLPAGLTYSNPDFAVITLPSLATGTYIWNAALIAPTGPIEPPFIDDDTWDWYFYSPVGTETPTEDITTVLEQAKTTVVIDFGK